MYSLTPKAIMIAMTTDFLWQFSSQEIDPLYETQHMGGITAGDFMGACYPFAIAGVAFGMAAGHSYFTGRQDTYKEQDKQIGYSMLLGILGWFSGYYLAGALGLGRWGIATFTGIGSAAFALKYQDHHDTNNGILVDRKLYATLAVSMFMTGFCWYIGYVLPNMIGGSNTMRHIDGGLVAPVLTALSTGLSLLPLYWYQQKATSQTSSKQRSDLRSEDGLRTNSSEHGSVGFQ